MADLDGNTNATLGGDLDTTNFGLSQIPGWQDRDAQMDTVRETRANTPDDDYARIDSELRGVIESPENRKALGEGPGVMHVVDDDRTFAQLSNVDPAKTAQEAIPQAAGLAIDHATHEHEEQAKATEFKSTPSTSPTSTSAPKPMDLEKTIAAIQLSASRDQRFVVVGDPKLEVAFLAELESRGKLHYQGGTPIIGVSKEKAADILRMVVEREGGKIQPALKIEFDRTGNGGISSLMAGVKNLVGRQHSVEVFAVGSKETIDKKLEEVGALLQKLDKERFISSSDKNFFEDGKLKVSGGAPVSITATRSLQELVALSRNTVGEYSRDQLAKDDARREFRNQQQDKEMAKAGVAMPGADAKSSTAAEPEAKKQEPSKYVSDLQSNIHTAVMTSGGLSEKDGKQVVAEKLLNGVRNLKDQELQPLPVEKRQEMLTNVALIVGKADSGTFKSFDAEKLDKVREADPAHDKAGAPSIREKVTELLATEKARDPDFESKALQQLSNLVNSGVATREQAESAANTVAPGRQLPPPSVEVFKADQAGSEKSKVDAAEAPGAEAAAQRSTENAKDSSSEQGKQSVQDTYADLARDQHGRAADSSDAARSTNEAAPSQSKGQESFDFSDAAGNTSGARAAKPLPEQAGDTNTKGQDSSAADARSATEPASGPQLEAGALAAKKDASSDLGKEAAVSSATNATDVRQPAALATAEAATPAVEKISPLVEKIDSIVKAGPDSLTREDASALLAALDGRQTAKLASLDGRSGTAPTETLVRIEGILNEVSKGRHGDDLAAAAKGLGDALNKWKGQDVDRIMASYDVSHADIAAKANEARSAESAWHTPAAASTAASVEKTGLTPDAGRAAGNSPASSGSTDGARQDSAVRYTETEMAAGKLANLMANPAGSFTNRDKSWNERNVDAAVQAVMRIDVESTSKMSQNQRNQVASYAAFLADNANSGRLPGFDGADGKARAEALTQRAIGLIDGATGNSSPTVTANLAKADRLVNAMSQRSRGIARAGANVRGQSAPASAAVAKVDRPGTSAGRKIDAGQLGKEIGHAMFKAQTVSAANAKFMLKNSDELSATSMSALSAQEKAQAVIGLARLADEVRNGGLLGDFKTLTPAVQKMVITAEQSVSRLHSELGGDKAISSELGKAHRELNGVSATEAKMASASTTSKSASPSIEKQATGSTGARGMER